MNYVYLTLNFFSIVQIPIKIRDRNEFTKRATGTGVSFSNMY